MKNYLASKVELSPISNIKFKRVSFRTINIILKKNCNKNNFILNFI